MTVTMVFVTVTTCTHKRCQIRLEPGHRFTLTAILPRGTVSYPPMTSRRAWVDSEHWILSGRAVDSIRDAVFTVSPNKQNLQLE